MQQRVTADPLVERRELGCRGQLAVDEQPRDLEVGAVLRQLLDRVSAIAEDALIAVDVGDVGLRRRRVDETVIERGVTGLLRQRRDVDARNAVGASQDREFGGGAPYRESGLVLLRARVAHRASLRFLVARVVERGGLRHPAIFSPSGCHGNGIRVGGAHGG